MRIWSLKSDDEVDDEVITLREEVSLEFRSTAVFHVNVVMDIMINGVQKQ